MKLRSKAMVPKFTVFNDEHKSWGRNHALTTQASNRKPYDSGTATLIVYRLTVISRLSYILSGDTRVASQLIRSARVCSANYLRTRTQWRKNFFFLQL